MNEENKNQKPEKETPTQKPAKPTPEKTEEKPAATKVPLEKTHRPKECASCGKNIDKKWYYREGKYYCGKGCWKKIKKQAQDTPGKETADKK